MKQELKKLSILFLLMMIFNSSQEKECVSLHNCMPAVPTCREKIAENTDAANYDELVPISPVSRFILIQY